MEIYEENKFKSKFLLKFEFPTALTAEIMLLYSLTVNFFLTLSIVNFLNRHDVSEADSASVFWKRNA